MDNLNTFQRWASDYARAFGWIVTPKGNWIEMARDGETHEVMSAEGVQALCQTRGAPQSN